MAELRFAARDPREPNRGATPLELLFDLAAVVAIAAAARGLTGALAAGETLVGAIDFACSFFMIWWAWMNYTWFASAYDDDSSPFRVLTMATMFGALMMAAGVEAVFAHERIWLALAGFVVMRVAMIVFWIAAARGDPARRGAALRYAGGIAAMQCYWVVFVIAVPPSAAAFLPLFLLGAAGELAVPALAERKAATSWHRGHIMARYGRLNLIVLGQSFLAIVATIELAPGAALPDGGRLWLAALFALIAFSMWSLYFTAEAHLARASYGRALLWGYGHFLIFGAGAAVGAGMHLALARIGAGAPAASWAVAVPAAVYTAALWLLRDRYHLKGAARWLLPGLAALLALLGIAVPASLEPVALALVAGALARAAASRRAAADGKGGGDP